ncbi:MAG: anthranilate phosphoribosyltransferase [Desulfovibrionales bacterium]|nr:anthranilate phosphoribosyltransferase [Desulfovibrionales bacterium]
MNTISHILEHLSTGADLSAHQAKEVFDLFMAGEVSPVQAGAFLLGLRAKGETADELSAAVEAALSHARLITGLSGKRIDTCGTGGDCRHSFNCSTAVSFFLADRGYQVVKHGNRAVSSTCGSADVVEDLGYPLVSDPEAAKVELAKRNFVFLFAPHFHPAFRHVGPIRQQLGIRTIFNLMGPLLNPALPTHQILGVPDFRFAPMMGRVLATRQGLDRAAIVHGAGGFDELTPCGPGRILFVEHGSVREAHLDPDEFGMAACSAQDLSCPSRGEALQRQREVLSGRGSQPLKDMVALNLGLALHLLEDHLSLHAAMNEARAHVSRGMSRGVSHA